MQLVRQPSEISKSLSAAIPVLLFWSSPAAAETAIAPAADFAVGTTACSVALGPKDLNVKALQSEGWSKTDTRGPITLYGRDGIGVKIYTSKMFAGSGQCVVDGFATDIDQFDAIRDAIRDELTIRYGEKLKLPDPVMPGAQGFVVDDILMILSTVKKPEGLSVRVTSMRIAFNK